MCFFFFFLKCKGDKKDGVVVIIYCKIGNQVANLFTKSLPASKFEFSKFEFRFRDKKWEFVVQKSRRSVRYFVFFYKCRFLIVFSVSIVE